VGVRLGLLRNWTKSARPGAKGIKNLAAVANLCRSMKLKTLKCV